MINKNVLPDADKGVDFSEFWEDAMERPTEQDRMAGAECCCNIPRLNAEKRLVVNGFGEGFNIEIPKGRVCDRPIQLQSVVNVDHKTLIELHHVITIGEGAKVQIIHCDDTVGDQRSLSNNQVEIHIGANAEVEYCKLQNLNNQSGLINRTLVTMAADSRLTMNSITLNGGHVSNHIEVRMQGEGCELVANGLYLIDRNQKCDNYIFVEHAKPHCYSNELYKGIIDDQARASFNGHVLVQDGAVKTQAFQSNKNILLTDKAHVETQPFLEIYNDDVKCSHGSTIGQLDEQAMFYLQTRGIPQRTAMTMLSYAFCDEVIRTIGIPELRSAVEDMVKKRLHGELTPCSECAIRCGSPCNGPESNFVIDTSKW